MTVKKNIPSYVTIDGEKTNLSYYGQQQTCKYCTEYVHNGVSCVQNKKLLVQKLAANNASYADVMKNPTLPRTKPTSSSAPPAPKKNQQLTNVDVCPSTSSMPPPADKQGTENSNQLPKSTVQLAGSETEQWVRVTRKSGMHKKTDGNETDSSTSSRHSVKRPVGKKMRCDGAGELNDNALHQ